MELTYEEADMMVNKRLAGYPRNRAILADPELDSKLSDIMESLDVDPVHLDIVKDELKIILSFYAPFHDFAPHFAERSGVSLEEAEGLALLIEATLLETIQPELRAYEYFWEEELKRLGAHVSEINVPPAPKDVHDPLHLRPQTSPVVPVEDRTKPLTREEVLRALAPKRTMQSDIESVRQKQEPQGPV